MIHESSPLGTQQLPRARATSEGRFWSGMDAGIYEAPGGVRAHFSSLRHDIIMHVGTPVHSECRVEGAPHRRLQRQGDIDIVPAGAEAEWTDDGPSTFLRVSIEHWLLRATAESMGLNLDNVQLRPQLQLRDPRLQHLAWAIKHELESDDQSDRIYADSLGMALAAHLLRCYSHKRSRASFGLSQRQLERIDAHIDTHLEHDLSLRALTEVSGIGPTHFKALFKRSVGLPVHKYVVRRRVEAAIKLLAEGKLGLCDVAMRTGFADQSHMARCMRRELGMTPSAIARSAR